jgi:hypothetical protein
LRSRLPSKLTEADTAIAIEAAQLFAAEWCKFVCIDGPNLEFKYKRMDGSLYVTLSFQNEELLIANLHDGCLSWALRFLAQERDSIEFKKLMSMLLGGIERPECYPVFALHSKPGEYLAQRFSGPGQNRSDWTGLAWFWTGLAWTEGFRPVQAFCKRSASQSRPVGAEGLTSPGQSSLEVSSVQSMDWTGLK